MSRFFDDLEAQLHAAARARTGSEHPEPRRTGLGWLRTVPVLAATALTIAVAVGAIVLLGHRHHPSTAASSTPSLATLMKQPRAALERELGYIAVLRRSWPCRRPESSARMPATVLGAPSQSLLSLLAVLRRPATAADRLPAAVGQSISGVYIGAVRRARVLGGAAYYVIPVHGAGVDETGLSPQCASEDDMQLHRGASRIPAAWRTRTVQLAEALLAADRVRRSAAGQDSICVGYAAKDSGGYSCGFPAAGVKYGAAILDGQGIIAGVVPDGVAAVRLSFPGSSGHRPLGGVSADVVGNVFAVAVGSVNLYGDTTPISVTWLSASGRVLRTVDESTRSPFCVNNPGACGSGSGGYATSQAVASRRKP